MKLLGPPSVPRSMSLYVWCLGLLILAMNFLARPCLSASPARRLETLRASTSRYVVSSSFPLFVGCGDSALARSGIASENSYEVREPERKRGNR